MNGLDAALRKLDKPEEAAGLAFLLSQVGAHASGRFAERLEPLELEAGSCGTHSEGHEAQTRRPESAVALGELLGIFASRLVAIVDELERAGIRRTA